MDTTISHEEYKKRYLGKRVDFDWAYGYQCVDLARDYCLQVRWLHTNAFWGSAYKGRLNRATTFPWKDSVSWFACVPIGSVVIFKPFATIQYKKPWALFWSTEKLTSAGHVAIVDYIDNSWVIRVVEQNGTGNAHWINGSEIRLWWYRGKDTIAWFILQ